MKTLNKLSKEQFDNKISVDENSINYISKDDLKKYLEVANNFISEETKEIVNYLIVNNDTYISDLSTDNDTNALAGFYNAGMPEKSNLKELWKCIDAVNKNGRLLEIPVFQTPAQFNSIISKKVLPDTIILDLKSEAGKNEVAKRYTPLVHKICRQFMGKSSLDYNELLSAGFESLVYAMNTYGKKKDQNTDDKYVNGGSQTFGQYAAYMIRFGLLGHIETNSRTVRVSKSAQAKEKRETGKIARSNSISGDKTMGIHNSEDGNKTLFDFIDSQEYADNDLDRQDLDKLWKEIYDKIKKEFGDKIFNIWCDFYGMNNHKRMQNKELAKKYNVSNSSITYYCVKVNSFIKKDKELFRMIQDVYELMKECRAEEEQKTNFYDSDPVHISNKVMSYENNYMYY